MTWPHPLTHPSTQPPTHPHPPIGGSVSTNHKSSNRIELSWFSQQFLNFYWFDLIPPIKPPTHPPPNYTPTPGWGSLYRFQIFKQNWNILISSSAIEFWLILGSPQGGGGVGGWACGVVMGCPPHTCTCTHAHACAHVYDIIGNSHGFPHGGGHLHEIIMFTTHTCACMCVHACVYMCTCVGGTPNHSTPTPHPPQSCREPETPKFNNSWTNQDNSILFEDSLPLNIPELI